LSEVWIVKAQILVNDMKHIIMYNCHWFFAACKIVC